MQVRTPRNLRDHHIFLATSETCRCERSKVYGVGVQVREECGDHLVAGVGDEVVVIGVEEDHVSLDSLGCEMVPAYPAKIPQRAPEPSETGDLADCEELKESL